MTTYVHKFPTPSGLVIGVTANKDGKPMGFNRGIPFFAKYFLLDEFDCPVLDESMAWLETIDEALYVAEVYQRLVAEGSPMPDRMFHGAYMEYVRLKRRLPMFIAQLADAKIGGLTKTRVLDLVAELLKD